MFIESFLKIIRYGVLKIMKKMWRSDDKRPIIATANHILEEMALPSGFRTFRDASFRSLARFEKLPVSEHDRIFNELIVSAICVPLFCIERMKEYKVEEYHFWQNVGKAIPQQFQYKLMSMGLDGGNAKLMRELITLRYEEYEKFLPKIAEVHVQESADFKNFSNFARYLGAAIHSTAIGTADHIRRGDMKPGDPLVTYLIHWLMNLQHSSVDFVRKL